jgi:hypothetical protein
VLCVCPDRSHGLLVANLLASQAHRNALTTDHATKLKMENEAETRTIRLTSEIIRCIAKALLASAEELERTLWPAQTARLSIALSTALLGPLGRVSHRRSLGLRRPF